MQNKIQLKFKTGKFGKSGIFGQVEKSKLRLTVSQLLDKMVTIQTKRDSG